MGGLHSHTDAVICVGVEFHGVRDFPVHANDIYPSGALFLTSSVYYFGISGFWHFVITSFEMLPDSPFLYPYSLSTS